jgi:hypothetical protein
MRPFQFVRVSGGGGGGEGTAWGGRLEMFGKRKIAGGVAGRGSVCIGAIAEPC